MANITELKTELTSQIAAANDLASLEQARVAVLGKKGRLTAEMKTLGGMRVGGRNGGRRPGSDECKSGEDLLCSSNVLRMTMRGMT